MAIAKNLTPVELIQSKIVVLRGEKVMIDRDLAQLYGVSTKALKQAVRRNLDRFPSAFTFHLHAGSPIPLFSVSPFQPCVA